MTVVLLPISIIWIMGFHFAIFFKTVTKFWMKFQPKNCAKSSPFKYPPDELLVLKCKQACTTTTTSFQEPTCTVVHHGCIKQSLLCNSIVFYKIWGFAWWKSVSSRFAVTPCVISTIAKLRYRFWKEPNRTTCISTVAKWEIWFRENHGDFTGSSHNSILII